MGSGITSPGCCGCGGGGGGSGTIPLCLCSNSIPSPLTIASNSTTCNDGMFQNTTVRWQPTPALYGGALSAYGANNFYSDSFFTDGATGYQFQYVFHCERNLFVLTQLFPTYPGQPGPASINVYNWSIGATGNVCQPFAMTSGVALTCTTPGDLLNPNTCICGQYPGGIQVSVHA